MASDLEIKAAARTIAGALFDTEHSDEFWFGVAKAALEAAEKVREPVVFVTAEHFGPQLRCTVNGPQHIIVERA